MIRLVVLGGVSGIESDLIVGDPERALLDLRETGQGDSWDLSKPHRSRCLKPAMTCDDKALGISKDGIGEAERFDGRADLIDLALRMGTGVARLLGHGRHCVRPNCLVSGVTNSPK